MIHDAAHKIATIDAELARVKAKAWYDEDDLSPDELLDRRLELMAERTFEELARGAR